MTHVGPTTPRLSEGQVIDSQNPWPGLIPYGERFQQFFHGRSQEADDLFRRVKRKALTVLYGRSGLGKTSLLRAGLFPKLRREGFLPVPIRLEYADDALGLAAQVKSALVQAYRNADLAESTLPAADESLWEYFHRLDLRLIARDGSPVRPVLVFDQFEEFFTLGRAGQPKRRSAGADFFNELADLIENRSPATLEQRLEENPELVEKFVFDQQEYRVLLSLREDYLAELESLQTSMPSIATSRMRLTRMNDRQAFEAVVGPGGPFVSAEVARAIVRFVGSGRPETGGTDGREGARQEDAASAGLEVEPSLLSLVCRELNNRRLEQGLEQITPDLLEGSRERILHDFYERSVADQPTAVRAFVEDELVTDSGFRENMALGRARRALSERGAPPSAIDELVKRRLLHVEEHLGLQRIELTHDILVPVVTKSRDQRQQEEAIRRAEQLQQEERRKARRQRRRLLAIVTGMAAALAVVSGFGAVSYHLYRVSEERFEEARQAKQLADEQAQRAQKQEGLAKQQAQLAKEERNRAERQTELAEEERKRAESQTQFAEEQKKRAESQTRIAEAERKRAEADEQLARRQKEAADGARQDLKQAYDRLERSAYGPRILQADELWRRGNSSDPERLLNDCPPRLRGWEWRYLRGLDDANLFSLHGQGTRVSNVAFSPDGKYLGSASDYGAIEIWDAVTQQRLQIFYGNAFNDLAFSPDSRFVAAGGDDKTIKIWEIASGKLKSTFQGHSAAVSGIAFSRDGRKLASLSLDRTVRVWNVNDGTEADKFPTDHEDSYAGLAFTSQGLLAAAAAGGRIVLRDPVKHLTSRTLVSGDQTTGLALTRDGSYLIAANRGGTIRVWETQTWRASHILRGHAGVVTRVAVSPDGKRIASTSWDRTVKVWDLESGSEQQTLRAHGAIVRGVAFNGDGQKLTACGDNEITTWSATDPQNARLIMPETWVTGAAFSPDGTKLATSSSSVTVYDARTGEWMYSFPVDGNLALCVAFNGDGTLLAAGSKSGAIQVWNPSRSNPLVYRLTGHRGLISTIAFHPSGPYLASASDDKTIGIWNLSTGTLERRLDKHAGKVSSVAFSPSGKYLASGSRDRTVRIWDTTTWKEHLPKPYATDDLPCVAFLSDDLIASGGGDLLASHEVKFWNPHTGVDWTRPDDKEPLALRGHSAGVTAIVVGNNRVATSSIDATAKIWDSVTGEELLTLSDAKRSLWAIALSPDGRRFATAGVDGVRVYDGSSPERFVLRGHTNLIRGLAFSPTGRTLASAGNAAVKLWDVRSGRALPLPPMNHPSRIDGVAFSPDGKSVAVGCSVFDDKLKKYVSGEVRIWEAATGNLLRAFSGHAAEIRSIVYHPGGQFVITASNDATVKIWNASTGRELQTLPAPDRKAEGHQDAINGLAISPDGARIATASDDRTVKIWDVASGRLEQTLRDHKRAVSDVAYSRDGKWLATAGVDRSVILWRSGSSVVKDRVLLGHIGGVSSVAFCPDNRHVVAGSWDGTVMGWDVETGRAAHLFRGHAGRVIAVASSPDGHYLASGGDDTTVRIWNAGENGDDVFAWHWRVALDLRAARRYDEALVQLDPLVEREPLNPTLLNMRGNVHLEAGQTDLAITDYSRALDIPPQNAVRYRNRAYAYRLKKESSSALADYSHAVSLNPRDDMSYYWMGNIRHQNRDYAGAIADFNRELAVNPSHAQGFFERGQCKLAIHDRDGAIEDFSRAIILSPGNNVFFDWRAEAHFQKGVWKAAIADYTRELAITPSYAYGYYQRGRSKFYLGDLDSAADDFSKAISLAPKFDKPVYWRAMTRLVLRDWRGALTDFYQAVALHSGFDKPRERQSGDGGRPTPPTRQTAARKP